MPMSKPRMAKLEATRAMPTVIVRLPANFRMSFMELSGKPLERTRIGQTTKFDTWPSSGGNCTLGTEMGADCAFQFANR